ncbi:hypothetical protein [Rahnella aceris]|uniref:hypothetical protein n=1 Tax=Rahnella sp. (strain Y9602) TaxID=2703885 RepID=UPI001F532852|nr:hypothetical protein [Rahnella aceris]UNK54233.1 hypothetical protein MNO10_05315 [Rahnella aceris]
MAFHQQPAPCRITPHATQTQSCGLTVKKTGKQTAHHLVYDCAMQAFEKQPSSKTVLLAHPVLAANITERDLDHW